MRPAKPIVTKRPYGTGTVEARWLGERWRFRAKYPDGRGGQRNLGTRDAEDDAHALCNAVHEEHKSGAHASGSISFKNYGERFLKRSKDRNKSSWLSVWNTVVSRAPFVDDPLDELENDRPSIKRWLNSLDEHVSDQTGEPISWQTQRHALGRVKRILQEAVEEGLIKSNPAAGIKMPKRTKRVAFDYLTAEEVAAVFNLPLSLQERAAYALAIYVGMRQGEICALDWSKVSLEGAPHVMVEASWDDDSTKTGEVRRAVLIPSARAELYALWVSLDCPRAGLVFPSRGGKLRGRGFDFGWSGRNAKTSWRRRAGIVRGVWFHKLRHTCASHLLMGTWGPAWSIKEVGGLLGHSSETMTERYAHLANHALDDRAASTTISPQPPRAASRMHDGEQAEEQDILEEIGRRAVQELNLRLSAPEANDLAAKPRLFAVAGEAAGRSEAVLLDPALRAEALPLLEQIERGERPSPDLLRALGMHAATSAPVRAAIALARASDAEVIPRVLALAPTLGIGRDLQALLASAAAPAPRAGSLAALITPVNVGRFWSRVRKSDGCWLWTGGRQETDGKVRYGRICIGKAVIPAHRFAWAIEHGAPADAEVIEQTCGEPLCVRHLDLTTRSAVHRRTPKGETK